MVCGGRLGREQFRWIEVCFRWVYLSPKMLTAGMRITLLRAPCQALVLRVERRVPSARPHGIWRRHADGDDDDTNNLAERCVGEEERVACGLSACQPVHQVSNFGLPLPLHLVLQPHPTQPPLAGMFSKRSFRYCSRRAYARAPRVQAQGEELEFELEAAAAGREREEDSR